MKYNSRFLIFEQTPDDYFHYRGHRFEQFVSLPIERLIVGNWYSPITQTNIRSRGTGLCLFGFSSDEKILNIIHNQDLPKTRYWLVDTWEDFVCSFDSENCFKIIDIFCEEDISNAEKDNLFMNFFATVYDNLEIEVLRKILKEPLKDWSHEYKLEINTEISWARGENPPYTNNWD